jgi:DNA-binding response OmpR family regulator
MEIMSTTNKEANKGTILIIEDESLFRLVYQDVLASNGYKVLVAEDGESGWRLVKSEKPSLTLLDLNLPKLHGLEVLRRIRFDETTKDLPVIILSVWGEQEDIRKGLDIGADDYLVKGFYSPREICTKIDTVLAVADITISAGSYKLSVKEGRADAAKLQKDIGLTKLFHCPHCKQEMSLELIPDDTRTDGHWFLSHFVCLNCKRSF